MVWDICERCKRKRPVKVKAVSGIAVCKDCREKYGVKKLGEFGI